MAPLTVLRSALALGLAGMGTAHLVPSVTEGMAAMIPRSITRGDRSRARALVLLTGVCEIAGGAGLLRPATRRVAAIALIVFLAAVFPANVVAARDPDRFGAVAVPLVPRAVAQAVLAALVALAGFGRGRVSP